MTAANWWRLLPLEPAKFTRVVVFDTETSGFSNDDEILEIGAIELEVQPPSLQSPQPNILSSVQLFNFELYRSVIPQSFETNAENQLQSV